MEVAPPQLPALPDHLNGLNLLQYVAVTASQNQDPAIQNQMNLGYLFALGVGAWIKWEINIRIALQGNPNTLLVSYNTPLTALGIKTMLVRRCGVDQHYSLGAYRASLLHSAGRNRAKPSIFGRGTCTGCIIYPIINRVSIQDAIGALLSYWGLVGVQEDNGDARLYDWLWDVIEWEIF